MAGYFAVTYSLSSALKNSPELAHTLAPTDGQITARLAQNLLTPKASPADQSRAERLARLALRQDPTAVKAVATLGLISQVRGNVGGARRLFAYAEALSRRELQTQLWAIEDAVSRNDIPGALRQYDIALRTSRVAPDLLFPVLASASSDPGIGAALVTVLTAKPSWSSNFVDFVAANGPDPRASARMLRDLERQGIPVSESAKAAVTRSLVSGGYLDQAWDYYSFVRRGANRRASRDPHFARAMTEPLFFDWAPIHDGGVITSVQSGGKGGIFDFSTPPSVGGPLLQQMQLLPPGNYRLEGHSIGIDQPAESRPYWVLICNDGQELSRIEMPNSKINNGMFSGRFSVPAHCVMQTLLFVARSSDSPSGTAGQIDYVRLLPDG